jgi:hypothetical protein
MNNRAKKILMLILFLFSLAIFQNFISLNKSVIFNDYKIAFNNNTIFSDRIEKYNIALNLTNITSYYSLKFELVRISYQIQLFDCNNNLILPSDLSLYYKLHVLCFIKIKSFNIYSLASIEENKYFKCSEFFKINENIQIYFLLYETENDGAIKTIIPYLIINNTFNYNYKDDNIFNSVKIKNEYKLLLSEIKNNTFSEKHKLKKSYISEPLFSLKSNYIHQENKWIFANIFNEYYCFCKGSKCLYSGISQSCKYYFYLHLIDINRNVYRKTDFLLMDFVLKKYCSDDVFPIFEEMINQNLNAHYLTENNIIYERYCNKTEKCDKIINVDIKNCSLNGDFLENYLTLILKLKQVISSVGFAIDYINNLFYNIEYISYICVGHGIAHFKHYLYQDYYGPNNFDKILVPDIKELIDPVIRYGWKEENIIKLNLPRWDKYNIINGSLIQSKNISSNSIFVMFTWRELNKGKSISPDYIKNIIDLLSNKQLINNLLKHNLVLYFTLHHKMSTYKFMFKNNDHLKYIEENDIAECLSKTKLLVTDFSSIIFDMIYRKKPYIIFIPDGNDPNIKDIYRYSYYKIINSFKNNEFQFENINFNLIETLNKIDYYINNDFQLDIKLQELYNRFNFSHELAIKKFINYTSKF